jgi:hypothetical protein
MGEVHQLILTEGIEEARRACGRWAVAAQDFRRHHRAWGEAVARHRRQDPGGTNTGQGGECGGMSERTQLIAMATAVALTCLPASAQTVTAFYSGNALWNECSDNHAFQFGLCMGFVAGIADAMNIAGTKACFPPGVTVGQTVNVVKQFLGQHPERRHETAVLLVASALGEAFPCKK